MMHWTKRVMDSLKRHACATRFIFSFVLLLSSAHMCAEDGPLSMVSSQDNRFEFFLPSTPGIRHLWQDPNGHWVENGAPYQPAPNMQIDASAFEPRFTQYRTTTVSGRDKLGRLMVAWISKGRVYYAAANGVGASLNTPGKAIEELANVRSLALATNQDGRLELFTLSTSGYVTSYPQESPGIWSWGYARDLSKVGLKLKMISVTAYRDGRLVIVGVTKQGGVVSTSQVGPNGTPLPGDGSSSSWTTWRELGGENVNDVVAQQSSDHRLEIVAYGGNGVIYHRYEISPDLWSPWGALSSEVVSGPIQFISNREGRMEVIARRTADKQLIHIYQLTPNGGWAPSWAPLIPNSPGGSGPTAVAISPSGVLGVLDFRLLGLPTLSEQIFFSKQVLSQPNLPTEWSPWEKVLDVH